MLEEYVENELAGGEDDEKRIQRADFRAGKKLKSAKKAKNKKGSGPQSMASKIISACYIVLRLGEGLSLIGPWHS